MKKLFMYKQIKKMFIFFVLLAIVISSEVSSQVSITGPGCVTPGTTYQYMIGGSLDSAVARQVCVTGGVIGDSASSCQSGFGFSLVKIIWSTGSTSGVINITSSEGNGFLNVVVTPTLQGGMIESTTQTIDHDSIPLTLTCQSASGGSCSPVYGYQWQQSSDQASWVDVTGASGSNLIFLGAINQTIFYRRKVIETNSSSIGYSTVATVFVNPKAN